MIFDGAGGAEGWKLLRKRFSYAISYWRLILSDKIKRGLNENNSIWREEDKSSIVLDVGYLIKLLEITKLSVN